MSEPSARICGGSQFGQIGNGRVHTFPLAETNVACTCNNLVPHLRQWIESGRAERESKSSSTGSVKTSGDETDSLFPMTESQNPLRLDWRPSQGPVTRKGARRKDALKLSGVYPTWATQGCLSTMGQLQMFYVASCIQLRGGDSRPSSFAT